MEIKKNCLVGLECLNFPRLQKVGGKNTKEPQLLRGLTAPSPPWWFEWEWPWKLIYLNTWSPVGGTLWGGKKVWHNWKNCVTRDGLWGFKSTHQSSLSFSVSFLWTKMWSLSYCSSTVCLPTAMLPAMVAMDSNPLEQGTPNSMLSFISCLARSILAQQSKSN